MAHSPFPSGVFRSFLPLFLVQGYEMSRQQAAAILSAADRWKQRCLLDGGSLFGEERLWTGQNFDQLRVHVVESPDAGSDPFYEKLRRQLDPAPPEAKRLWSELTWAFYLIVRDVKPNTKRDRIAMVWEWSGARLPEDHWALDDDVLTGCANLGSGRAHQWLELGFTVLVMLDWFTISGQQREELAIDPWKFADWLAGCERVRRRWFRHALLFLLFPDWFEPIVVGSSKREIVKGFARKWGDALPVDEDDDISIDRKLLEIRKRLEADLPGEEIDFYQPPFEEVWRADVARRGSSSSSSGEPPGDASAVSEGDDETWFRKRFGEADVWAIAPGAGARRWTDFQQRGIAAIDYEGVGDLGEYQSLDDIRRAAAESGLGDNPINHSLAMWDFAHEMSVGDILIAKRGVRAILGWGTVRGSYVYDPDRTDFQHVRKVEWHPITRPVELPGTERFVVKTLTRWTRYPGWVRRVFRLMELMEGGAAAPPGEAEQYDVDSALQDVFIPPRQFTRMLDALAAQKNLILQGPPGVGKTWIAKRLAWCLIGRQDPDAVEMVQFHQSYAYEDFVQGWRPTETGGFALRNGVFFEFCKRAEARPDTRFVFIIDEVNRGNLSRIFGELLMLVERDKRGPAHAIPLTYSGAEERFFVPDNVHVLGMMNTADRSLAMVDYALRRRFAFEALMPAYGTDEFREHLLEAGVDRKLVDRIETKLMELNERIREDKDLGPGFQIGHSFFVPDDQTESVDDGWYESVVETQIAPLLREYWFDRPERAEELAELLRR